FLSRLTTNVGQPSTCSIVRAEEFMNGSGSSGKRRASRGEEPRAESEERGARAPWAPRVAERRPGSVDEHRSVAKYRRASTPRAGPCQSRRRSRRRRSRRRRRRGRGKGETNAWDASVRQSLGCLCEAVLNPSGSTSFIYTAQLPRHQCAGHGGAASTSNLALHSEVHPAESNRGKRMDRAQAWNCRR
ncbi:unnamed protein product, partial [Prorocentrum cordatum]